MTKLRCFLSPASVALSLLALALPGCGDGVSNPLGDLPPVQPPPPPPPPPAAPIVGDTVYALDISNRLLVFGTESFETPSLLMPIRGVPIFSRIVGIDFRPSTGELYGVGNDSRVYKIDPATAQATAVSDTRFEPGIAAVFDTHFGMTFDPETEEILLISQGFDVAWIIDPDDGTAESGGQVRYAAGDVNEGKSPGFAGLSYAPPIPAGALPISADLADCEKLLVALGAGALAAACDGELDFETLFEISFVGHCATVNYDSDGNVFASMLNAAGDANEWLNMNVPEGVGRVLGVIPTDSPLQDTAIRR